MMKREKQRETNPKFEVRAWTHPQDKPSQRLGNERVSVNRLRPQLSVERAILDRFGNMFARDFFGTGQICNRAGDF